MEKASLIILAAGKGTRMGQEIPKCLTELNGICLIENLLNTVNNSKLFSNIYIVVGFKGQEVVDKLGSSYNYIWQKEQLGTGHAAKQCESALSGKHASHLILYGDVPFISEQTIKHTLEIHEKENSVLTMVTLKLKDFEGINKNYYHFGRILRDDSGEILKIVEFKDATDEEKNVTELNPAIYCIKDDWLWENLNFIKNNNHQSEYYLTDLVGLAHEKNVKIKSFILENNLEMVGVNNAEELSLARSIHNQNNKNKES